MENKKLIRQGDLLFVPVSSDELPADLKKRDGGVIQEGESTGHAHWLGTLEGAEIFEAPQGWRIPPEIYVRITVGPMEILHEEHRPVVLPAGTFKVTRAREFDYLASQARFLAD